MPVDTEFYPTNKPGLSPITVIGILFFPVTIVAFCFDWLLFRKLKYRPSFSLPLAVALSLLFALLFWGLSLGSKFVAALLALDWGGLILPLIVGNLTLGFLVGGFFCWYEDRRLKKSPWLINQEGEWFYKFSYRRSPFDKVRLKKEIDDLKAGEFITEEATPLGIDETSDRVVYRYLPESYKHTLITGASGSGKTITMLNLIDADIQSNRTVFVIDFKNSLDFTLKMSKWAKEAGREFYHFSSSENYMVPDSPGQCTYDPFAGGNADSKADKLLALREWDTASDFYRSNTQTVTKILTQGVAHAYKPASPELPWDQPLAILLDVICSSPDKFALLVRALRQPLPDSFRERCKDKAALAKWELKRETVAQDASELLDEWKSVGRGPKGRVDACQALRSRLRVITTSNYGPWLRPTDGVRHIDIQKLASEPGNVVLFSFSSNEEPEFAKFMGSLVFADLTTASAYRFNHGVRNPVAIYADEFQSVNPESVAALLEKGREAKMSVTLGLQSLDQIVAASSSSSGEAFLKGILGTCSTFITHAGAPYSAAERMSELVGKTKVADYDMNHKSERTFLSINFFNRREQRVGSRSVEDWIYSPDFFMDHSMPDEHNGFKSTATVLKKDDFDRDRVRESGATAQRVWMIPPSKITESLVRPMEPLSSLPDFEEFEF